MINKPIVHPGLTLLCLLLIGNLQAQNNCRYGDVLAKFTDTLPHEKIYVHTDRSLYEPGETIWFKAYLTDATLLPGKVSAIVRAELIDPRGNKIKEIQLPVQDGSTNGDFELAKNIAGGLYKLRAYTVWQQNFEETLVFEKEITVQKTLLPNILMQLDFMRESYGPGSKVIAKFKLRSKDNYALADYKIDYILMLQGKQFFTRSMKTNGAGHADIEFELPKDLSTADALLNIMVEYDEKIESISRSVPISTQKIDLQFLPEGGNLVGGGNNTLAFKALNEFGKAADIEALIYDESGKEVAKIRSYHQGMGSFAFRPETGSHYTAKIIEPQGVDKVYQLPVATQSTGLQMLSQSPSELVFNIHSAEAEPLCIIVQMQDKVQFELGLEAKAGDNEIRIPTHSLPMGIAQITVFDARERPHCERLVFVNKNRNIQLKINTNKDSYGIRDSILLDITVSDETGRGIKGDFSLAVVDDKTWTFADDKQANILSQLLLCSDLRGEVFEPNFYFDPKEAKADSALNYLMLTQGWRRYEWKDLLQKADSSHLSLQIKHPAEPNRIIEGVLKIDGEPLPNYKITLEKVGYCGELSPKFVMTDEKGFFSIPNIDSKCSVKLNVGYRGFQVQSEVIDLHLKTEAELRSLAYDRKTGVILYDAVTPGNTIMQNPYKNQAEGINYYSYTTTNTYDPSKKEQKGDLYGKILNENGEELSFASLMLYRGGTTEPIRSTSTDFDGNYYFSGISSGEYDLAVSYVGYPVKKIIGFHLGYGQVLQYDLNYTEEEALLTAEMKEPVMVITQHVRYLEANATMSSRVLGAEDIQRMATRNIASIAATTAGVTQKDEGEAVNTNGSRKTSGIVMVDGVRGPKAKKRSETVATSTRSSNMSENSAFVEMNRSMGYNFLNEGAGRNRNLNLANVPAANTPDLKLTVMPKGKSSLYFGKIYYAPDYSKYLNNRSKPYKATPVRKDFRQTVYWQPFVSTDSAGKASILYFHSDATGTFRILLEGVGKGGKIGRAEQTYSVKMPFELEVKMPKFLCAGDTLHLPVLLRNQTNDSISGNYNIHISSALMTCLDSSAAKLTIAPNQSLKHTIRYAVGNVNSEFIAKLEFNAEGFHENLEYPLKINPKGFPVHSTVSGNEKHFKGKLTLSDTIPGSLKTLLEIHISNIESLLAALAGMIREPYGCFEQVSSSNYPNILALEMMQSTNSMQAGIYDRAQGYLDKGYKKLAGYESAGGGFEWFGGPVGHEGLTAFGLMEFYDMERVYTGVDKAMTDRAKRWLLSRKDGQGGWQSGSGYNHGWGQSRFVANAYIVQALAYIGEKNIEKELKAATEEALKSKDLYRLGLVTLANYHIGNNSLAENMTAVIFDEIAAKGMTNLKAEHSITYSYGTGLKAEILSFAILAGLKAKKPNIALLNKFSNELLTLRSGGYFGNTQATVWALKALTALSVFNQKRPGENGNILVKINGQKAFSQAINNYGKNISVENLAGQLKLGENLIEIDFEGMENPPPYSFDVNWQTYTPSNSATCTMHLQTELAARQVKTGETVRLTATLANLDDKSAPTPMAIIGIPGGLSVQAWQLKELQDKGVFDFYELQDDYLILYYRGIDAGAKKQVNLDLKADVPGVFRAPASCTYLYYSSADKFWTAGENCRID